MVTLKDIAERVGVSITTVSRVLNGKGSISQETKDKVFQVMRELNYYPNEMARSLVNKNSHIIGLIVPYIDHPFFSALTAAIEEASSHAGYKLFLCISGGNQERELEQFAALQANNVAGVLVCTRDSYNMDELLNRRNIPLVSIERSIEGVPSKPCATPELLARVRAMLRRKENYLPDLLTVGGLALNRSTYELSWQGKSQSLSGREFQILEMLMERPGFVVTTNQLLSHVWGWDSDVDCSVVWVHISNIRKKLARLGAPAGIRFLRGAGYVLEVAQ